jgi:hypothetical protein
MSSLPPAAKETLALLGRIGVRAVGKFAESVLEDISDAAETVAKKTKRAKNGLGKIPRERRSDDD